MRIRKYLSLISLILILSQSGFSQSISKKTTFPLPTQIDGNRVYSFTPHQTRELARFLDLAREEKEQLKKDKEKNDKEKSDVKFSQIMAMAKLKLDNAKYNEIYKKGETLKLSELDSFERDVKAFICDTVVFSEKVEENAMVSFGTHMTLTETEPKGLWN